MSKELNYSWPHAKGVSSPQIVLLWRWYRSLPLSEQFYVEWVAFGIVCLMWTLFVVILAVML